MNGVGRGSAHLVSRDDQNRPAYGGTPSDSAVVQAIQELKARGYRVTFYPFILMDVPADNDAAGPVLGQRRGDRPADLSLARAHHLLAGRGLRRQRRQERRRGHAGRRLLRRRPAVRLRRRRRAGRVGRRSRRLGPAADDPALRASLRRGGRGRRLPDRLGAARDHAGAQRRVDLSGGRRARRPRGRRPVDPRVRHQAQLRRRLVGVLRPPPAGRLGRRLLPPRPALGGRRRSTSSASTTTCRSSDWRDGLDHLDAESADAITDLDYLRGNVEGGEGFDWFYASAADREAQVRTPITDGAAGKPVGLPLQGHPQLVVEPAPQPPGRGRERRDDGVGAGEQADPLHRDRLPGGRPRPEPAERLLRPEVGRELPAVLLPRLARRRGAAALPRGGARLLGRAGEQPDVGRLLAAG